MLKGEPVIRFAIIRIAIYILGIIGLEVTEGDIATAVEQFGILIPAAIALIELVTTWLARRKVTPMDPTV